MENKNAQYLHAHSYLSHFQTAQNNLNLVIQEERLLKRRLKRKRRQLKPA